MNIAWVLFFLLKIFTFIETESWRKRCGEIHSYGWVDMNLVGRTSCSGDGWWWTRAQWCDPPNYTDPFSLRVVEAVTPYVTYSPLKCKILAWILPFFLCFSFHTQVRTQTLAEVADQQAKVELWHLAILGVPVVCLKTLSYPPIPTSTQTFNSIGT